MAYKLYLDKQEDFSCDIDVKNASLKDALARLVVEANGINLMFPGYIKDGKCSVPIRKLKGLLEENSTGKMHLEVVVDDTYFKPWNDNFVVEEHTSVKVKVPSQNESISRKPVVEVKKINTQPEPDGPTNELLKICEHFGINKQTVSSRKNDFKQILKEFFSYNKEYNNVKSKIVEDLSRLLR